MFQKLIGSLAVVAGLDNYYVLKNSAMNIWYMIDNLAESPVKFQDALNIIDVVHASLGALNNLDYSYHRFAVSLTGARGVGALTSSDQSVDSNFCIQKLSGIQHHTNLHPVHNYTGMAIAHPPRIGTGRFSEAFANIAHLSYHMDPEHIGGTRFIVLLTGMPSNFWGSHLPPFNHDSPLAGDKPIMIHPSVGVICNTAFQPIRIGNVINSLSENAVTLVVVTIPELSSYYENVLVTHTNAKNTVRITEYKESDVVETASNILFALGTVLLDRAGISDFLEPIATEDTFITEPGRWRSIQIDTGINELPVVRRNTVEISIATCVCIAAISLSLYALYWKLYADDHSIGDAVFQNDSSLSELERMNMNTNEV